MTAIAHPPAEGTPDDEAPDGALPPETPAELAAEESATTTEGLRLIARFVRRHPVPFAVSLIGGVSWSAMVVGATYVLGRITDEVIEPAFDEGVAGERRRSGSCGHWERVVEVASPGQREGNWRLARCDAQVSTSSCGSGFSRT